MAPTPEDVFMKNAAEYFLRTTPRIFELLWLNRRTIEQYGNSSTPFFISDTGGIGPTLGSFFGQVAGVFLKCFSPSIGRFFYDSLINPLTTYVPQVYLYVWIHADIKINPENHLRIIIFVGHACLQDMKGVQRVLVDILLQHPLPNKGLAGRT
ncbi:hypothetical protein C8Q75DRAFT_808741 [Abortiporus biennis]|nr:hypothetical protein C8Q75DRAFT_808741 [Abortiporus biennis]